MRPMSLRGGAARAVLDHGLDFLFDVIVEVQTVDVRLPEVIEDDVRILVDRSAHGNELVRDEVQERRFSAAVRADDADAVPLENFRGEVFDEFGTVREMEGEILDLHHSLRGKMCFFEYKVEIPLVLDAFRFSHACDRLDFGLHHRGFARFVAELVDDAFQLLAFLVFVRLGAHCDFLFGGDRFEEFCDGALDFADLFAVDADDMRRRCP